MSETFEEYFKKAWCISWPMEVYTNLEDCWNHQQQKIDQLQKENEELREILLKIEPILEQCVAVNRSDTANVWIDEGNEIYELLMGKLKELK